jgi:hypothetical protein
MIHVMPRCWEERSRLPALPSYELILKAKTGGFADAGVGRNSSLTAGVSGMDIPGTVEVTCIKLSQKSIKLQYLPHDRSR